MSDKKKNLSLEAKEKMATNLHAGNQRSYTELQAEIPGFTMDTSDLRREMLIEKLVEWGVISEDQAWDFEIAFNEKVEASLNGAWEQVRAQKAKAGPKLSVVKKPTTLVDKGGRPLS